MPATPTTRRSATAPFAGKGTRSTGSLQDRVPLAEAERAARGAGGGGFSLRTSQPFGRLGWRSPLGAAAPPGRYRSAACRRGSVTETQQPLRRQTHFCGGASECCRALTGDRKRSESQSRESRGALVPIGPPCSFPSLLATITLGETSRAADEVHDELRAVLDSSDPGQRGQRVERLLRQRSLSIEEWLAAIRELDDYAAVETGCSLARSGDLERRGGGDAGPAGLRASWLRPVARASAVAPLARDGWDRPRLAFDVDPGGRCVGNAGAGAVQGGAGSGRLWVHGWRTDDGAVRSALDATQVPRRPQPDLRDRHQPGRSHGLGLGFAPSRPVRLRPRP